MQVDLQQRCIFIERLSKLWLPCVGVLITAWNREVLISREHCMILAIGFLCVHTKCCNIPYTGGWSQNTATYTWFICFHIYLLVPSSKVTDNDGMWRSWHVKRMVCEADGMWSWWYVKFVVCETDVLLFSYSVYLCLVVCKIVLFQREIQLHLSKHRIILI